MKISVFSLFRDSVPYIEGCLRQLEAIEEETPATLEYYFYENDSLDQTASILGDWLKKRKGRLLSEVLNEPSYGSTLEPARMVKMARLRNKMASLDKPTNADFCLIFDSDVQFSSRIVNDFLEYGSLKFAMLTPNIRQNVPCKMGSGEGTSYYDSLSLFDLEGNQGMTWSTNPFYEDEDRENFTKGEPIEVSRAFGGIALVRGAYFNKVKWASNGNLEHWEFCDQLRQYGKIFLLPSIMPQVSIEQKNWPHEEEVIKRQRFLLDNRWERFLLKAGAQAINI